MVNWFDLQPHCKILLNPKYLTFKAARQRKTDVPLQCAVTVLSVCLSVCLLPAQEKAEGEPKVKKGKSLLDDDDDEDNEEGADESLEEVRQESQFIFIFFREKTVFLYTLF